MKWLFAVLGLAVGLLFGWSGALVVGEERGRNGLQQEIQSASVAVELEREKGDAANSKLSDGDLCRQYLGARGLSLDACDLVRGVPVE